MGKRRRRARQDSMWVPASDLPRSAGHPFYERLNQVLDEAGFDAVVETQCAKFYAAGVGRPSLAPGRYFRLLLLGYFEGLDSERAMAWRAADSLSVRHFLDLELHEASPDHSTVSRTRRLIDVETHQAVFTWVLQQLADAQLVKGTTIGIDATTLEANAAVRSIVRRDTGESYAAFLTQLAEASGIATPTRAELARFDRKRKKKGANDDWTHPQDPDAKITKMKDGRTHLAHKAEHAVDLETGAVVSVTVQDADDGDTTTMVETLRTAAEQVEAVRPAGAGVTEIVADKGYHSNQTLTACVASGLRSYISEPGRGRRNWRGKAGRARRGVCQPPADSRHPGATPVAATRRTARTSDCAPVRDGPAAPDTSPRASQHLEAPARARLRVQSRVAHAAADGRRHAAQPPRSRAGILRRPDRPRERVLDPRPALVVARSVRGSADRLVHTTTSARAYRSKEWCFTTGC